MADRFIPPRNLQGSVYQAFVALSKFLDRTYGTSSSSTGSIPVGGVIPFAGTTAPSGWRHCDGSSLLRADFPELFTAIGTAWGSTSGTTFNLPDFRGRAPIGAGLGPGLTNRALASSGGAETHALTTSEMPSHTHGTNVKSTSTEAASYGLPANDQDVAFTDRVRVDGAGDTSAATGSGGSHNNMQPWRAVNYIIRAA